MCCKEGATVKTLRRAWRIALAILLGWCQVQTAVAQSDSPGRKVLIGFNHLVETESPEALAETIRSAGGQVEHSYHLLPVILATLSDETIGRIRNRPDVAYVEEDGRVYAAAQEMPWGVDRIGAERVWDARYGGSRGAGVDVAILDTGIDASHPDLVVAGGINCAGNILTDGSTKAAHWNDKEGHGTHCAGVVAARNNGIGVVGVAPEARLWAVKVLADDRSGHISDVIQGIEWCVDNGIDIVSMSFTGGFSSALGEACDLAYNAGVLLIASSGNDGTAVGYPAAYGSVLAVSAVDTADSLASFSCVGPEIELTAPGVDIRSTYRNSGYTSLSGTSMACPHVAGVAALVWASPELGLSGAAAVRARLRETAEPLAGLTARQVGYGLVDAEKAALPAAFVDLAIADIAVDSDVVQGDSVEVVVTVENVGNQDCPAGVAVTVTGDAGSEIGSRTTTGPLSPGASTTLTYRWNTTGVAAGVRTLRARHNMTDDDATNDTMRVSVTVRTPIVDIAITAVSGPAGVTVGDSAQISVTVANTGDEDVDADVAVSLTSDQATPLSTADDIAIGTRVIEEGLSAGQSTILKYTWDTHGAAVGVHTITASHDLADDDSDDDWDGLSVTVSAPAESSRVTIWSITPRSMWAGMPGTIMIRGTGFVEGVKVTFEKGQGPAPAVTGVRTVGSSSVMGRVTLSADTLPVPVVWDVRVTNPDGSSAVLRDALTIQP